jgi:serine/threonine protein kinase
MPDALIHPTPQELTAFGLGQLAETAAAAVADHLAVCPVCRQAVENLPPDAFPTKVRAARPGDSSVPPGRSATLIGGTAGPANERSASPAPPAGLPPELVDHPRYRIIRELGRGGMGVVYQAVQILMDRPVAVKVINPSLLAHPDALPRFQSEVKTAAKLDHPNIVRAHDAEQVGHLHLLVMEYVEGTNLADLVQRKGPLPIAHACHFIRQAALGLQHAFEQGMVHRDIKPQNLMVTSKGVVKILDFGLARLRSGQNRGGGLTEAGSFMGTPDYVSPEQATDARTADTRADIYSLGCALYFLLTGRPPFVEDTPVKTILAHIEKPPPSLGTVRPEVPPELAAVVERMLAKDPAQRYQQPVEVAQALAPFVKQGTKPAVSAAADKTPKLPKEPAAKDPPLATPVKEETPDPFATVGDAPAPAEKPKQPRAAAKPMPAAWYRRPPVLAGAGGAALVLGLGVWLVAVRAFDKARPQGDEVTEVKEPTTPKPEKTPAQEPANTANRVEPPFKGLPPTPPAPDEAKVDPKMPDKVPVPAPVVPDTEIKRPMPPEIPSPVPPPADTNRTEAKPDPFDYLFQRARGTYEAAMRQADGKLLAAFDQELDALNRQQKLTADDRLKFKNAVREERIAFATKRRIPWSPWMRKPLLEYLKALAASRRALALEYDKIIDSSTKASNDAKATEYQAKKRLALQPKVLAVWTYHVPRRPPGRLEFLADGTVNGGPNVWRVFKDRVEVKGHGWTDKHKTSSDGKSMAGANQVGVRISAQLVQD